MILALFQGHQDHLSPPERCSPLILKIIYVVLEGLFHHLPKVYFLN